MHITLNTPSEQYLYRRVIVDGHQAVIVSATFERQTCTGFTVEYSERAEEFGIDASDIENPYGVVHEAMVAAERIEWTDDFIDENTVLHSEAGEQLQAQMAKPVQQPSKRMGKAAVLPAQVANDFPRHRVKR